MKADGLTKVDISSAQRRLLLHHDEVVDSEKLKVTQGQVFYLGAGLDSVKNSMGWALVGI